MSFRKKEEQSLPKVPGDPGYRYDLKDPSARSIIKDFEKELSAFSGPYAFELYCVSKGYFNRAQIRTIVVNKEELPEGMIVPDSYEKPELYSINGATLVDLQNAEQKFEALKRLQWGRAQKEMPIITDEEITGIKSELPF